MMQCLNFRLHSELGRIILILELMGLGIHRNCSDTRPQTRISKYVTTEAKVLS